ncbi:MAG: hypothetical protein ACRC2R_09515 [Xenococcaceae cyanobacterium]
MAQHEQKKDTLLTEDEVIAIRDKSIVMMMAISRAEQMSQMRGYHDIDPDNCWQEWQQIREYWRG